jgi:hypothetical protein
MLRRLGRSTTFANVCSLLALTIAVGTGGAYAANTVFSTDIVDGEVKHADLAGNSVTSTNIYNGSVLNAEIGDNAVDGSKIFDASISAADLGFDAVDSGEIAIDAVHAPEIAPAAVGSSEIAAGSVHSGEIAEGAVQTEDIGINEVQPGNVANNSLTALDMAGGRSNGSITLNAGYVANGRCRDFGISVPNAVPGDAVVFSINTSVPHGIVFNGVRVSSDDVAVGKVCNFTGAGFPQLNDIQVAIFTLTL